MKSGQHFISEHSIKLEDLFSEHSIRLEKVLQIFPAKLSCKHMNKSQNTVFDGLYDILFLQKNFPENHPA